MKHSLLLPLVAGLALDPSIPVHAEDAVVVTATRFPERLLDSGVGMSVITSEQISASTATTLPELLSRMGRVHVRNNAGSPDQQLDMRGFGITGDQNTLVLLDGVRINENDLAATRLSAIPLNAIERIEILPGSGAVQYGPGASGGTINIITRGPRRGERGGALFAGLGSYGTGEVRAGATLTGDRLGLRLDASHQGSDGYRQNNRLRQDSVAGDLRLLGGDSSLALKFGADEQRLGLPGVRNEDQFVSDPRGATNPSDWSTGAGDHVTVQGKTDLGRVELAVDANTRGQLTTANFQSLGSYLDIKTRSTTVSPRLRWRGSPAGFETSLVAGVDLEDWDYRRRIAGSRAAIVAPFSRTQGSQSSRAFYLRASAMLDAATKATAGWRVQRVSRDLTNEFFGTGPLQQQTRTAHAGEIGLHHALGDALALFGKLGTSFRFASVDENGFTATGELLEPQTARHREAGVEYRANGTRWRVSAYAIDLDKEIYFSPLVVPFGANTNLSPTRRTGLELHGGTMLARGLEVSGSLALQTARFKYGVYGGVDVSGRDIPLVPRSLATLRLAWQASPRTRVAAALAYTGAQRYDNDQDNAFPRSMPAYAVADLKLTHQVGDWTLSGIAANLFDKRYASYGIVGSFACTTPVCVYPQPGRSVFASAEYRFK